MKYGKKKDFDFAKEVVRGSRRSSWRKFSKRQSNKTIRHSVKQRLTQITCEDDWDEDGSFDYFDDGHDKFWVSSGHHSVRYSSLKRWALAKTNHLPREEKLGYMKGFFPDKKYRRLRRFLKWIDEFDNGEYGPRYRYRYRNSHFIKLTEDDIRDKLEEICNNRKALMLLNDTIRGLHKKTYWYVFDHVYTHMDYRTKETIRKDVYRACDKTIGPRLLMGVFDIDDFIDDINEASTVPHTIEGHGKYYGGAGGHFVENPAYHSEWKMAVKIFIDKWVGCPNNMEALKNIPRDYDYYFELKNAFYNYNHYYRYRPIKYTLQDW